jgi:PEGA domain
MTRFQSGSRLNVLVVFLLVVIPIFAKDTPLQTIEWPSTGTPTVRFTFSKFKSLPGMSNLHGYVMDTTAQNLSPRRISSSRFNVYLFDKNKVRVGQDVIAIQNVGPGEVVKFETTVATSGQPVSVSIEEITAASKTVSLTVNSTPQGANLAVDGTDMGTTPRMITIGAGHHTLAFTKQGFATGAFPLDISANDLSGGSVSYELGAPSFDTIELRDGTVLNGDLVSVSGMDTEIRVGGTIQHIDRNKIKRVLFVHRDAPAPDVPPASAPPNN